MASANAHSDSAKVECNETPYTVQDMALLQAKFARESIGFLLWIVDMSQAFPNEFKTRHPEPSFSSPFTRRVAKAITTIAYVRRIDFRKKFRIDVHRVKDSEAFRHYIKSFPIPKTDFYLFYFLAWVAFTFEFTVYCLKGGNNFIDEGIRCLESYPDLEYFHSRGGWGQLLKFSKLIAKLHDQLEIVISREMPTDDLLLPFMKTIKHIKVEDKKNRNQHNQHNLVSTEMRLLRAVRRALLQNYDVIYCLDRQRIMTDHKVRMKESSIKSSIKADPLKESDEKLKLLVINENRENIIDDLVDLIEMTRISEELSDRSPESEDEYLSKSSGEVEHSSEIDEEKSMFKIERLLKKVRNEAKNMSKLKKKSHPEVHLPAKQTRKMTINKDILDMKAASCNNLKVICPSVCDTKVKGTQVEETSSEDSDNTIEITRRLAEIAKHPFLRGLEEKRLEMVRLSRETAPVSNSGAESSNVTKEHKEPPKLTGAIPKTKTLPVPSETLKDLPR